MDLYALLLLVYRVGQVVISINVWEDLFNISFQLKYSREVYQVWTFQRLIFLQCKYYEFWAQNFLRTNA